MSAAQQPGSRVPTSEHTELPEAQGKLRRRANEMHAAPDTILACCQPEVDAVAEQVTLGWSAAPG